MPSTNDKNEESLSSQLAAADAEKERLKKLLGEKAVRAAALEVCAELGEIGPMVANLVAEGLRARLDERGVHVEAVDENRNTRFLHTSYGSTPLTARDVLREVKKMPAVERLLEGDDTTAAAPADKPILNLTDESRRAAERAKMNHSRELEGLRRTCQSANPFSPATRNLTIATRLVQLDPTFAKKLQDAAA